MLLAGGHPALGVGREQRRRGANGLRRTSDLLPSPVCHASAQPHATNSLSIEVVGPSAYWPCADVHCRVFYDEAEAASSASSSSSSSKQTMLQSVGKLWQRVDRIMALQINDSLESTGVGRSILLAAYDTSGTGPLASMSSGSSSSSSSGSGSECEWEDPLCLNMAQVPPAAMQIARKLVNDAVQPGLGKRAEDARLLAVANLDSFGDLVPPRSLDAQRDGAFGYYRREGIAYVSNVAVLPGARRRGLARALMDEAERIAAQWGCRAVGLHCNPKNKQALALYSALGYKATPAKEAPWMPYLQGRPPDRCVFYLKRLKQPASEAAGAAAIQNTRRGMGAAVLAQAGVQQN